MQTTPARRVSNAVAAAVAMAGVGGGEALAQTSSPLLQGLMGAESPQSGAREFATPDGAVRFVFDRTGRSAALVRFQGDPEVHVLRPVGGVGGDEIYRAESGDVMLRLSRHGGITVYTRANRNGAPAAEGRIVAPLAPPTPPPAVFQSRMRVVQVTVARSVGRPVALDAPANAPPTAAGVVLEAAERAAASIASSQSEISIQRIAIIMGAAPSAFVRGDTLFLQIVPNLGYAGRPSTTAIRAALQGAAPGPER